ncbi:MAG: DUF3325 domain-containing protein [Nitrospira sp.]|nr:DUF3325 domain-containing protein [Nitrospira sp.]
MRWVAFALSYCGLLAFCLAMPKHYLQVMQHAPTNSVRLLLRIGGWLMLMVSFAASVAVSGWSFGPVEWVGWLAVAGLSLVFSLPHMPRTATMLGVLWLLISLTAILL